MWIANGTSGRAQVGVDHWSYKGQAVYLGLVGISARGNDCYPDDASVLVQEQEGPPPT